MDKSLPIFDVLINDKDESGVDFISLVDEPAMELDWLVFSYNTEVDIFELDFTVDKEKKMLYGVFIIADKLTYRNDKKKGEYYVRFRPDQIEKIVRKFSKSNNNKNINFQHGDNIVKAHVVDSFITNDMVKVDFGYEVPSGSWVGSIHIEDDEFWQNYIKTGSLKGFSVELRSQLIKTEFTSEYFKEDMKVEGTYEKIKEMVFSGKTEDEIYDELSGLFVLDFSYISKDEFTITKDEDFEEILFRVETHTQGQQTVSSSNVKKFRYFFDSKRLRIEFRDGSRYEYEDVSETRWRDLVSGFASCKTSGSNRFGSWSKGKIPSLGAAVHKYLINAGISYRKL